MRACLTRWPACAGTPACAATADRADRGGRQVRTQTGRQRCALPGASGCSGGFDDISRRLYNAKNDAIAAVAAAEAATASKDYVLENLTDATLRSTLRSTSAMKYYQKEIK